MSAVLQTEFVQPNSPEWMAARRGCLGASKIHDATRRLKSGKYPAERDALMVQLAAERLTGLATEHFVSQLMWWGIEHEADALDAYAWDLDVTVEPVGWVPHPTIQWAGATPDGQVGEGLCEVKCPQSHTHVRTLLTKEIAPEYIDQMYWQQACMPHKKWSDFISYDPRMPKSSQLCVLRLVRNPAEISRLETEARIFLEGVAEMVGKITGKAA